tara:strand:- start:705 stop:3635 length:2931 start_codon:yes stop_codon:yes gene_type:complete
MKYIIQTIIAMVLSFSAMGQIAPYQIINDVDGEHRILMTDDNGEYIRVSLLDAIVDSIGIQLQQVGDSICIVGGNCIFNPTGGKFIDGTDTNDAIYMDGDVGIGTNSPQALLDVGGTIYVDDESEFNGPALFNEGLEILGNAQYSGTMYNGERQEYLNSSIVSFNQEYTGNLVGSYFEPDDYQKVVTISPNGSSEGYHITGRIYVQSGAYTQTLDVDISIRSNTLPDLSFQNSYINKNTGINFVEPFLWTKETTNAGAILGFKVLGSRIYGSVTVDLKVNHRYSADKLNTVLNTVKASDQLTIDAGFTSQSFTKRSTWDLEKIGIGVDNPSALLDIGGTLTVSGDVSFNGDELYVGESAEFNGGVMFSDDVEFNGDLTSTATINADIIKVTDRVGGAAVKGAFFDANNQLIEGNIITDTNTQLSQADIEAMGFSTTDLVDDADNDPANEIQDTTEIVGLLEFVQNNSTGGAGGKFVDGTDTDDAVYIAGNVGIGTTDPDALLHVKSTGNGEIEIERNAGAKINIQAQSARGVIGTDTNHELDLKTNATTRVRILNNGNVGINDTAPTNSLSVNGTYSGEYPKDSGFNNVVFGGNFNAMTTGLQNFTVGQDNGQTATTIYRSALFGLLNANLANSINYTFAAGAYNNQNNLTSCNYNFMNGYLNAREAQALSYSFFNGRENAEAATSTGYSFYNGYQNLHSSTQSTNYNFMTGRQNAYLAFDSDYSFIAGYRNAFAGAANLDFSFIAGLENAYNSAGAITSTTLIGSRNGYTTTGAITNSTMIGFENGKLPTVALNNTILLGFRQGYSVGSKGAASYRLAVGMYEDDPLIYGEFDNKIVEIDAHLTVENGIQIEIGDEDVGRILYSNSTSGNAIWGQADNVGRITTTLGLWSDERQVLLAGTAYSSYSAITFPPSGWTTSQQHDGDILTLINRSGSTRELTGDIESTTSTTVDVLDDDTIRLVYYSGGDYWIVLSNN